MGSLAAAVAAAPLLLLVITWVAMGELLQGLQVGWQRPWALTFAIHSGYALALVPYFFLRRARRARGGASPLPPPAAVAARTLGLSLLSSTVAVTWYASLNGTSVAGNSAVYQSSGAFALLFSAALLGERATRGKLAAVAASLAGVALVAAGARGGGGRDTPAGYAWVIASTALYALYEVLFSRLFAPPAACGGSGGDAGAGGGYAPLPLDEGAAAGAAPPAPPAPLAQLAAAETSALVLGCMGVWTLFTQWPVFFAAAAARLEPLDLAPPGKARLIAAAVALDAVYNLALLWSVSTSSPFVTSLATTLVVPATIVADLVIHSTLPSPLAAAGTVVILGAVAALLAPPGAAAAARARCGGRGARAAG